MEVIRSFRRADIDAPDLRFILQFADEIRIRKTDSGYEFDVVFIEYNLAKVTYGKIVVNDDGGWKELTDRVSYRIVNDQFVLGNKTSDNKYSILLCRPVSKLEELRKLLEDENSSKDVKFFCDSIGLKVNYSHITYLMRLIAELYDDFEIEEGHKLILSRR